MNDTTNSVTTLANSAATSENSLNVQKTELQTKMENLRLEMEKLNQAEQEQAQALAARRIETVKGLPTMLGLEEGNLRGVLKLIRKTMNEVNSAPRKAKAKTPKTERRNSTRRGVAGAIPESVKTHAIEMRKAGTVVTEIAKRLKVSEPTCWNWFRDAGLAGKRLGGKARRGFKLKAKGNPYNKTHVDVQSAAPSVEAPAPVAGPVTAVEAAA
jgi:hypothetical protein